MSAPRILVVLLSLVFGGCAIRHEPRIFLANASAKDLWQLAYVDGAEGDIPPLVAVIESGLSIGDRPLSQKIVFPLACIVSYEYRLNRRTRSLTIDTGRSVYVDCSHQPVVEWINRVAPRISIGRDTADEIVLADNSNQPLIRFVRASPSGIANRRWAVASYTYGTEARIPWTTEQGLPELMFVNGRAYGEGGCYSINTPFQDSGEGIQVEPIPMQYVIFINGYWGSHWERQQQHIQAALSGTLRPEPMGETTALRDTDGRLRLLLAPWPGR